MPDSRKTNSADQFSEFAIDETTRLNRRWDRLCARYLPLRSQQSIWRYSRELTPTDPFQGWKIHVSATVLTASDVLSSIGPQLQACGTLFKTPTSLHTLMRINSGIFYGYSQIGKIVTVYPQDEEDFLRLTDLLRPLVKKWPAGPLVPFDLRFKQTCIYYRYGSFRSVKGADNNSSPPKVLSPAGVEIEDQRNAVPTHLDWVVDPLNRKASAPKSIIAGRNNPLNGRYVIYRALSQRGKGGVYECLDMHQDPPRICILKEGRKNGETGWDGRDGRSLLRNEARVLASLESEKRIVPRIFDQFRLIGNEFLVLEKIDGIDLRSLLIQLDSHLTDAIRFEIARQVIEIVEMIHDQGWIWRDCKPGNFVIDRKGLVKAIDLEGAYRANWRHTPLPWSTPLFAAPELLKAGTLISVKPSPRHDLFALGLCLFQLITGRVKLAPNEDFKTHFRPEVPVELKRLILELLSHDPLKRPNLFQLKSSLRRICAHLSQNHSIPDLDKTFLISE